MPSATFVIRNPGKPRGVQYFQLPQGTNTENIGMVVNAIDCFKIIDSCLKCYYSGDSHMFKPLAGQLRILFCDTNKKKENSLIHHIYPDIKLLAFQKIQNQKSGSAALQSFPYFVETDSNGTQIAEIDIKEPYEYLSLPEWRNQAIDLYGLDVKTIIKSVANKGGGAHIDKKDNSSLRAMKSMGFTGIGMHILFIIALARYTLTLGEQLTKTWEK